MTIEFGSWLVFWMAVGGMDDEIQTVISGVKRNPESFFEGKVGSLCGKFGCPVGLCV